MIDAKLLLNSLVYPKAGDNAIRKTFPLHDTQAIATGDTEYNFFETALGDPFSRNKRFPLASDELFVITGIAAFLQQEINTTAEIDNLNELLQQSYLEIWNNSKRICQLPGLDFINYQLGPTFAATASAVIPGVHGNLNSDGFLGRKLSTPIAYIGNSSFKFKFKCTTQSATDFNGINLRLYLYGIGIDKLGDFPYSNLKAGDMFQDVPFTFYETRAIADGNETTSTLFESAVDESLQSGTFPLSDIEIFQLEALEYFVNQPDTPISPETIYNSRITNQLKIRVDERDYWDSVVGTTLLSMIAGFDVTLTTTPDTTVTELLHQRKQYVLPVPIAFPANGKTKIQVVQPASSLGITGEFTLCMRGTATRRLS